MWFYQAVDLPLQEQLVEVYQQIPFCLLSRHCLYLLPIPIITCGTALALTYTLMDGCMKKCIGGGVFPSFLDVAGCNNPDI